MELNMTRPRPPANMSNLAHAPTSKPSVSSRRDPDQMRREINKAHAIQLLKLEHRLDELQTQIVAKDREVRRLQHDHREKSRIMAEKHSGEVQRMSQQIIQLTRDLETKPKSETNGPDALSVDLERVNGVPRSVEANHVLELDELKHRHLTELKELETGHLIKLDEFKANYDKELDQAKEQLDKAMQELKEMQSNHVSSHTEKEAEHSSIVSNLNKQLSVLNETSERTQKELAETRGILSEAQKIIEKRDHQLRELESALENNKKTEAEATTKRIEALTSACEKSTREWIDAQNLIKLLRNELNNISASKEEEYEKEKKQLVKENEEYLVQKQQSFHRERLDFQSKHQSEVEGYKSQLAALEEKLHLAESENMSLKESHRSEVESLRLERLDVENQSKQEIARLGKELETCQQNIKELEETKQSDIENAVRQAETKAKEEGDRELRRTEENLTNERQLMTSRLQELEDKWKQALVDADKVNSLENRLKEVTQSGNLDKQKALDELQQRLQNKFQRDLAELSSSHEKELDESRTNRQEALNKLKRDYESQIQGLSQFNLREELRLIKSGFEKDKQDAINQAVDAATTGTNQTVVGVRLGLKSLDQLLSAIGPELETANKNAL